MARKASILERIPLAPVFAVLFGAAAAILVAATPQWLFDSTVASSGLANLVPAAQPPLGVKARLLAILLAFLAVGGSVWLAVMLAERALAGPHAPRVRDDEDELDLAGFAAPVEEPLRKPIFAGAELGAPLMSDEALRRDVPLPEPLPPVVPEDRWNLDEAFEVARRTEIDPDKVEEFDAVAPESPFADDDVPVSEAAAVVEPEPEPLAAPLGLAEFDLLPAPTSEAEQVPGETSIDALMRRLEAGLARRGPPRPRGPGPGAPAPTRAFWLPENDTDYDTTRALATLQRMVG